MKEKGVEIISTFSSSRILLLSQALCRAFENQPRSLVKHWILCFKIDYLSKLVSSDRQTGKRSGDMSPLISGPFPGFNLSPDPLVPTWSQVDTRLVPEDPSFFFCGGRTHIRSKNAHFGEKVPNYRLE